MNIKKIYFTIFFMFILLIFFFLLFEIISKAVYREKLILQNTIKDHVIYTNDPIISYINRPNFQSIDHKRNIVYVHNSNEFRANKNYSIKKPEDVFRILVLGDSVTYGVGVNQSDIYTIVLENMLNQNKKKYEVLNGAVGGYNTLQEYVWLKKIGLKYNPELVIVAYDYSDVEETKNIIKKIKKKEFEISLHHVEMPPIPLIIKLPKKISYFLAENSRFYQVINLGLYKLLKSKINLGNIYFYDTSLETTKKSIERIKKITSENNIDILFIVFPALKKEQATQDEIIIKELRRLNISTLILYDDFRKFGIDNIKVDEQDVIHPNKYGHKITAEKIYEYLVDDYLK